MKIAIVSDIHGNYFAYKKAKEVMMNLNVDHIFFLGDVFGYYYDGLEIFRDLLHTENVTMILGNHDLIFIDAFKNKNQSEIIHYIEKYGSSINDFLRDVTEDEIVLLESIPSKKEFTLDGIRFTLIHGGPEDSVNQRIYPDTPIDTNWITNTDILLLGHTHYRMVKEIEQKYILNPGSLGQPRDGLPPSFAIYNSKNNEISFIDVEFDTTPLLVTIVGKKTEPTYLVDVLNRWNRK